MAEPQFFKNIHIENFKSIKSMDLDCGRINLFIGKPNVGKSNILEALSLFCAPYSSKDHFLSEFVRYNNISNLFFDQNTQQSVKVETNLGHVYLLPEQSRDDFQFKISQKKLSNKLHIIETSDFNNESVPFDMGIHPFNKAIKNSGDTHEDALTWSKSTYISPVKKYVFKSFDEKNRTESYNSFLKPPYGENLLRVIESNSGLRKNIASLFDEYNLKVLVDSRENEIIVFKEVDGVAYKVPYALTADTFQRLIFHYAAILSNKNSILIFEEPEQHSFPPYIRELTQTILDSENNQFFISTHSPYLFNTVVENCPADELSVFITTIENYETKVIKLTDNDLSELLNYGVEVFFNLNMFAHE